MKKKPSEEHSMVLKPSHLDYTGMQKIGRIVIFEGSNGVEIEVSGFVFDTLDSCRSHCTRATAWARDVLAAAVEADRLVPGGGIITVAADGPDDDE